ncbi:MAG TPA: A/G-specific adenine glycosylase [Candidatus Sulfotelmatobacter sp.]|jgi:A/G-specific adenine glycosylase|nr:A/G-specific adenine glycosylase [Candidatus Sulfotelmatobacter sp.]
MMLTGRALASFQKSLLCWFRQFRRDLPWRRTKDPYRIWLSEIMLQQTRVAAVIPYYERFLERFPNVQTLAEAPEEDVLRLWSGLGYYSRARNLQKAARQIVAEHSGSFPKRREQMLTLSGIGEYTASAISSIAFEEKSAVLDGNVARVLARLGAIRGDLRDTKKWRAVQEEADRLLDANSPGDWNQALMELGATVCTPRAPQCLLCPVAAHCEGRKLGIADELPEARKKRDGVEVVLASLVVTNSRGETLLLPPPSQKNKDDQADHVPTLVSNLWHFPTVSANGDLAKAGLSAWNNFFASPNPKFSAIERLSLVRHSVTYRKVTVHPFLIHVVRLPKARGAKTVELRGVTELAISNLTRKIAKRGLAAQKEISR